MDKYHPDVTNLLHRNGWWVRSAPTLPPRLAGKNIQRSEADIMAVYPPTGQAAWIEVKTARNGLLNFQNTWRQDQQEWAEKAQSRGKVLVWLAVMFTDLNFPKGHRLARIHRHLFFFPVDSLFEFRYQWGISLRYRAEKGKSLVTQKYQLGAETLFAHYGLIYDGRWEFPDTHYFVQHYGLRTTYSQGGLGASV